MITKVGLPNQRHLNNENAIGFPPVRENQHLLLKEPLIYLSVFFESASCILKKAYLPYQLLIARMNSTYFQMPGKI